MAATHSRHDSPGELTRTATAGGGEALRAMPPTLQPPRARVRQFSAVLRKELQGEYRQRAGVALALLSVAAVGFILGFALQGMELSEELSAALLWLFLFFGLSPGLGRSFLAEADRGTGTLLHTLAPLGAIYWGKLAMNTLSGEVIAALGYGVLSIFLPLPVPRNPSGLAVVIALGVIGFATALTLLSALVAAARHRGLLLPLVGLPLLIPVLMSGIPATLLAFSQPGWDALRPLLQLMLAYSGALSIVGFWLFDWVWRE